MGISKQMNWSTFQDGIYRLTEDEIKVISKDIIAVYRASIKDISEQIAAQYLKYLSSVGTDQYYNQMIKYNRLTTILSDVKSSYHSYSLRAQALTEHAISIAASNSYYRSMYASGWLTQGVYGAIPYELVELIVYGTSDAWKAIPKSIIDKYGSIANYQSKSGTLSEFILKNRAEELRQIQNTITTGLQQGWSYPQMASGIRDTIGTVVKATDGTLTATGAMSNAMRIVSTESTRAMNAGSFASTQYMASQGVNIQKMWNATLDGRVRPTHAALDNGKAIDVDDYFHIGDDQALAPGGFGKVGNNIRCRCALVDIIDGEKPQIRRGRNPVTGENEVFEWTSFSDWSNNNNLTTNLYGEIFGK